MTFSFDPTLSKDLDLVRFHIGDINSEGAYLEDETINALLTSEGSVGGAVISSLRFIITQLSSPNFKLDWLSVTNDEAREGFETILKQKSQEFGISASGLVAASTISQTYRADSDQYTSTTRVETVDEETGIYDGSDA